MYRSPMTTTEAGTCAPTREFHAILESAGHASTARLLHALSKAEAATSADLARALGVDRVATERNLQALEAIGLVDRAARAPLPPTWSVRVDEVQRAGLLWIAFATGNPDRTSTVAPADGSCCEPRRSAP